MKKKSILLLATAALALVGCGSSGGDSSNTIRIACVKLGYGTEWLKVLTKEYTKQTGVKFAYTETVGQDGNNNLANQIRALNGKFDIYGLRPNLFHELLYRGEVVANGQRIPHAFEPLTDIFTEAYAGESGNNTMEKKMDKDFLDYVAYDDNYYGVPWANGFMSFVRNVDVWEKFGYTASQYPRTTEEFFEMCDDMVAKSKAAAKDSPIKNSSPMIYSAEYEYYTSIVGSWFAQYEGEEEMQKFYAGRDPDGKRSSDMFTFDGITEALTVLDKIVSPENQYQHPSSKTLSFTQMQNYFLLGDAAFCVNGTWLEVENPAVKQYNYNIDYIKIPLVSSIVNNEKLHNTYTEDQLREIVSYIDAHPETGDFEGLPAGYTDHDDIEFIRGSRNSGSYMRTDYDHLFVIPGWSAKKDLAKGFLKWMYSDEALQLFYKTMDGHHLPALPSTGSYDNEGVKFTKFRTCANRILDEGYFCKYLESTVKDKMFCVAGVQSNFSNSVSKTGNVVTWLMGSMTPGEVVAENTNYMRTRWNSIKNAIGEDD